MENGNEILKQAQRSILFVLFSLTYAMSSSQYVNGTHLFPSSYNSFSSQLLQYDDTLYINYGRRDAGSNLLVRGFAAISSTWEVGQGHDYTMPGRNLYLGHRSFLEKGGSIFLTAISEDTSGVVRSHLYRCTPQGDTVWTREYTSATGFLATHSLIAHPEGGFVLLGIVKEQNFNNSDIFILRTDTAGNELWRKTYGVANRWEEANWVVALENENYIVGGFIGFYPPNYPNDKLYFNGLLVKFKEDGTTETLEKGRPLQTEWGANHCLKLANDSLLISSIISDDQPNSDYNKKMLFMIDDNLNIISQNIIDNEFRYISGSGVILPSGNDLVISGSWKQDTYRTTLTKFNAEYETVWERKYHFTQEFDGQNILADFIALPNDAGFAATGQVIDSQGQRIWFVRTDQYGCLVPDCHLADIADADMENFRVAVYPNPTSDMLYVFNPFPQEVKASLVDFMGKRVKQHIVISAQGTLIMPLHDQPSGIYFLQVSLPSGKVVTEKVIKQ